MLTGKAQPMLACSLRESSAEAGEARPYGTIRPADMAHASHRARLIRCRSTGQTRSGFASRWRGAVLARYGGGGLHSCPKSSGVVANERSESAGKRSAAEGPEGRGIIKRSAD